MRSGTAPQGAFFGDDFFGATRRQWGWIMALGVFFVALGTIALGLLFTATLASIFFFGVLLLAGGTMQALQAFTFHGWRNIVSHLLMSVVYMFAAYLVMQNPLAASAALTLLLAAALVVLGLIRAITAIEHREYRQWGWLLASGIVSVLLGVMIAAQWPATGFWVIGLFVALDLIFHGWAYIGLALALKEVRAD